VKLTLEILGLRVKYVFDGSLTPPHLDLDLDDKPFLLRAIPVAIFEETIFESQINL
jgi:hypothetical protein